MSWRISADDHKHIPAPKGKSYGCDVCRQRNNERNRETARTYGRLRRVINPEKYRKRDAEWKKANIEKVRAHRRVLTALANGSLKKREFCQACGVKGKLYAHHFDYSKPLEIIWLCGSCHKRLHLGLIEVKK